MGNSITNCSTATLAFNSDSTGGLAWAQWVSGNKLNWSYSNISNYPNGEPLNKPLDITSATFNVPYRFFSSLSTPTCGLNIVIAIGFMSNALVMFGLILWLFKNRWIALFAGFAAAFSPYHLFKATSHVPYVYSSLFIGIIWLYLWFREKPSLKRVTPLALLTACTYYFNGYYILLASALIGCLVLGDFLLDAYRILRTQKDRTKELKKVFVGRYRYIIALGLILTVLLTPLLYTQLKYGASINKTLALARGDINQEAMVYGARAEEFILPSFNNPLVPESYKQWRLGIYHGSNPTENTLYLGITVLALSVVSFVGLAFRKTRNTKLLASLRIKELSTLLLCIAAICFLLSLPPKLVILGHALPLPSKVVIHVTESWRVFARFYLVIQPVFVILAASGLFLLSRRLSSKKFAALVVVCFVAIFLEFLPNPRAVSGDLQKNTPELYHTISKDDSVKRMAEYPIMDFAYAPSLFTYQQIHGKQLYNAGTPALDQEDLDRAIGGLHDPQTLGVLRALNVDVITSRQIPLTNSGLSLYYSSGDLYAYRLGNIKAQDVVLLARDGFNYYSIDKKQISHRIIKTSGIMSIKKLSDAPSKNHTVSFNALPLEKDSAHIKIYQAGKVIFEKDLSISDTQVEFTTNSTDDLDVETSSALDVTNMNIR